MRPSYVENLLKGAVAATYEVHMMWTEHAHADIRQAISDAGIERVAPFLQRPEEVQPAAPTLKDKDVLRDAIAGLVELLVVQNFDLSEDDVLEETKKDIGGA